MKNCIITPTFREHFKYIKKYLESFKKYVEDKDIPLCFIISRDEEREFGEIVKAYKDLNIQIIIFDDLLDKYNILYTPTELLHRFDKYCYQTIKKLYAILDLPYDRFLLIDSESMWIKQTKMKDLFDSYFNHPYFAYSILSKREIQNQFQKVLLTNINYLLKDENKKWYLETFSWFIDKKILLDIIKQYGSPFDMVQKLWLFWNGDKTKIALFEGLLYYQFIDKNNQKYNYTILDIEKELKKYLGNIEFAKYIKNFKNKLNCNGGLFEFFSLLLTDSNVLTIADLCNHNRFNILRLENSDCNFDVQKQFLTLVQPNILAVSQEHCFGQNMNIFWKFKRAVLEHRYYKRFQKHFNLVKGVLCQLATFIKSLFSLPLDLIRIVVLIIKRRDFIFR
ncbi:DUF6492 family protein [Candidatus Avelusimicrobium fimicolum]|uniref:DUF6492 family protein n=1 Tax=Candidatus Avelusimicrobium fimicolum TaxID=3416216 RepID=UPI003D1328B1